ncbi:cell division ATP-binding protein FtsE [Sediminitomix flava]|nr:ATP-binding cassette domain-containing protein [Sediminitomix flava]
MEPVISVRSATIYHDETAHEVMKDISFDIAQNEFVYLIGKTGSGKSSILRTLYADLPFKKGSIKVVDYAIHKIKRKEVPYLRRKLGIIFQDFELLTDRTVKENLFFVMRATGWKKESQMLEKVNSLLEQVGLSGTLNKMPHQLSGGEQQRLAIARALINDPEIILADEPTGNLDPTVARDILNLFVKINQSGTAVLMATHQHSFLKFHPSRVLYCEEHGIKDISKGQIIERMLLQKNN